jgi:hypothetical protein
MDFPVQNYHEGHEEGLAISDYGFLAPCRLGVDASSLRFLISDCGLGKTRGTAENAEDAEGGLSARCDKG